MKSENITNMVNKDGKGAEELPDENNGIWELEASDEKGNYARTRFGTMRNWTTVSAQRINVFVMDATILSTEHGMTLRLATTRLLGSITANEQPIVVGNDVSAQPMKMNASGGHLLSYFNGNTETFETWEKQVRFLSAVYQLNDDLTKINRHEA